MSTPQDAIATLDAIARDMGQLSSDLAGVERLLEPVERDYEQFMSSHEIGLWTAHVDEGAKLPPEKLRERLAHQAMPPELYGRYVALTKSRKRLEKRIATLKAEADAQRSILSALKVEADATGTGLRRAA